MTALHTDPQVYAVSGDWHGDTHFARHAVQYAANHGATTIIHVGDFGYQFTDEFLGGVTDMLDECNIDLYFIDGNHENFEELYSYPLDGQGLRPLTSRITHIPRGYTWRWGSKTYMGFGGAASVDRRSRTEGISWWPQERIEIGEVNRAVDDNPDGVDILFTHDAPTRAWCRNDPGSDTGWIPEEDMYLSDLSGRAIQFLVDELKPNVVYHGHFHVNYEDSSSIPGTLVVGLDCNKHEIGRSLTANTTVRITS